MEFKTSQLFHESSVIWLNNLKILTAENKKNQPKY